MTNELIACPYCTKLVSELAYCFHLKLAHGLSREEIVALEQYNWIDIYLDKELQIRVDYNLGDK